MPGNGLEKARGPVVGLGGVIDFVFSAGASGLPGEIGSDGVGLDVLDAEFSRGVVEGEREAAVKGQEVFPKLEADLSAFGNSLVTARRGRFALVIHNDN